MLSVGKTCEPELLQGHPKGEQIPLPSSLGDKVFKAWIRSAPAYLDLVLVELAPFCMSDGFLDAGERKRCAVCG